MICKNSLGSESAAIRPGDKNASVGRYQFFISSLCLKSESMSGALLEKSMDWAGLIQEARAGSDSALGIIVSRLRNYLLSVANAEMQTAVRSKFSGSDIVQQSMLEAHQSIGTFCGDSEGELKIWLKQIVLSNLIDETRRYRKTKQRDTSLEVSVDWRAQPLAQPNGQTASWMVSQNEFDQQLFTAVQGLPARQRHVIEARHRDGKPYAKIAIELAVTEEAARKLWARGVSALKRSLGKSASGTL